MNEDKPVVGKVAFGPALSDEERKKRIDETLARQDRRIELLNSQPSPPTPRPDVEGIKEAAQHSLEVDPLSRGVKTMMTDLVDVCDHALVLEAKLKAAGEEIADYETVPTFVALKQDETLCSLLAALVEAGEKRIAARHNKDCTRPVAKQYLESGEETKDE